MRRVGVRRQTITWMRWWRSSGMSEPSGLPDSTSEPRRQRPISAMRFILTLAGWVIGLFALMRLAWVQRYLLLPFATLQQQVASRLSGAPEGAVVVDLSCTGADAIALCMGVVFAFPAPWRERVRGGVLGLLLITALNTLRIGTLSLVAANRSLLDALHLYVWPAALTIAVVIYVFLYMTRVGALRQAARSEPEIFRPVHPLRRFLLLATLFAGIYFALAPWMYESRALHAMAVGAAATAGVIMSTLGTSVTVSGNYIQTAHGTFLVAQECIATPLIPVYAAAVLSATLSPARRALAVLLGPLLFFGLGTARLLVLAVPRPLLSSHSVAIHGFSQMLLALTLVATFALWLRPEPGSWKLGFKVTGTAIVAGALVGLVAGGLWGDAIGVVVAAIQGLLGHAGHGYNDAQGALILLPAYQVGLLVALWTALGRLPTWRRLAIGLGVLALSQIALLAALGELFHHIGFDPHVSLIRAWAVGAPMIIAFLIVRPFLSPVAGTTPAAVVHEQTAT